MNNYYSVELEATPCSEDITDLMAAYLAEIGFESFVPNEKGLTAYISEREWKAYNESIGRGDNLAGLFYGYVMPIEMAYKVLEDFPMDVNFYGIERRIEGEDWNEEWEKNYFQPIVIEGKCVIHASFHKDVPTADYDIVIDPRMAFGTGHHDTTSQMVAHILNSDMQGKTVIDMGTGTGILAILAKMRGAAEATGIEIDPPAYENAVDNARLNHTDIRMICGDASALEEIAPADFLFANINRNIILNDIAAYASRLKQGGEMLLSGFYEEDVPMILEAAAPLGLHETSRLVRNNWTALRLRKE